TGRFASPELRYFVIPVSPSPAELYGLQPPGYPLCFGLWTRIFGFGWRQAFLFDAIIHLGMILLLCELAQLIVPFEFHAFCWYLSAVLLLAGRVGRPDDLVIALSLSSL